MSKMTIYCPPFKCLLWVISIAFLGTKANIFDSYIAYRQGSNAFNEDPATLANQVNPDVPNSVENVFAHVSVPQDNTDLINIVHCYSMRNGLYGSMEEVRIFWTQLDFSREDHRRKASAEDIRAVRMPTSTKIEQFQVWLNEELNAILMSQTKHGKVSLHIVPGPTVKHRPVRTFNFQTFSEIFQIWELLVLPEANKAIFYDMNIMGEIGLQNFPYDKTDGSDGVPSIKLHKVKQNVGKLMQVLPAQSGNQRSGQQLYILMTDFGESNTSLRIDVVSASQPVGQSVNIARINSKLEAAYLEAQFAEIVYQSDGTEELHLFATMSYQSNPQKQNHLTISEVCFKDGTWQNDRSQNFFVKTESLMDTYLRVLGIQKKTPDNQETDIAKFTVYLAGNDVHIYRAEFEVIRTQEAFQIKKAMLYKSAIIEQNPALTKVYFFNPHPSQTVVSAQSDFYFFITSTKAKIPSELKEGELQRVQDGLIYNEYFLSKFIDAELMTSEIDMLDLFMKNAGQPMVGIIYSPDHPSKSSVIESTDVDEEMLVPLSQVQANEVSGGTSMGKQWVDTKDECAMSAWEEVDYDRIPKYGISNKYVVSYLDEAQSNKLNNFQNTIALKDATNGSLQIYNNFKSLVTENLKNQCGDDQRCASYFALCFDLSSDIFNCNSEKLPSLSDQFMPRQDQMVTEYDLVGEAFVMDYDNCYLATPIINRIDQNQKLFINDDKSKLIKVVDSGEPPYFLAEPLLEWYAGVSKPLEIPFSEYEDPEGALVFLTVKLRRANKFAYFDYDSNKIIIEPRQTTNEDIGEYQITVQLTEYVDGVQIAPRRYELILTVGDPIPIEEPPPLKEPTPGVLPPEATIEEFLMNGKMKIVFSKPLNIPIDIISQYDKVRATEIPFYGEDKEIAYIRNILKIEIIPGALTDPELLGFQFQIISFTSDGIEIQFKFDKPLEISQNEEPERVKVTFNLQNYLDQDSLHIQSNFESINYVPRQIPSEAEAAMIESVGGGAGAASSGAMAGSFIMSLVLAASLNQLWSMMNGLQLAVHLPLFKSKFPANATFFLTFLIDVATFDMLPAEVPEFFFDFPKKDPYNMAFETTKYGSMYAIENLGTCYMLINVYILQCIICAISYCLRDKCKCADRTYLKYNKMLFWGSIMRLFFEGYLEISLSVFVSMTDLQWKDENHSVIFNNVFSIMVSFIICALPIFIATWYPCHLDKLDDEEFTNRYGNIYDGLVLDKSKEKRLIALFYPFWFVTRRLIFAFICILAENDLWLQISTAFFTSMINLCYLVKYQPLEDRKVLKLEIFNEVTNFFLLYMVMCFAGLVPEPEGRYLLGWVFIGILAQNMLVHFTLLIVEQYFSCRDRCRKGCCKKKQPEQEEAPKKELSVIIEEEEFESNFSEKDSDQIKKEEQVSVSDWDSHLGGSEAGYNMQKIKWKDLGQKYMSKRVKNSMLADQFSKYDIDGLNIDQHPQLFYTVNDAADLASQLPRTLFNDNTMTEQAILQNSRLRIHRQKTFQKSSSRYNVKHDEKIDLEGAVVQQEDFDVSSVDSSSDRADNNTMQRKIQSQSCLYENSKMSDYTPQQLLIIEDNSDKGVYDVQVAEQHQQSRVENEFSASGAINLNLIQQCLKVDFSEQSSPIKDEEGPSQSNRK